MENIYLTSEEPAVLASGKDESLRKQSKGNQETEGNKASSGQVQVVIQKRGNKNKGIKNRSI